MKVHECKRPSDANVSILKVGPNQIDIIRGGELSYTDVMLANITFCPYCGMNLKTAK